MPHVSVIIPFRNARLQLPAVCDALEQQTCPRDTCEVIWIDDGSTDDGRAWLEKRLARGWRVLSHPRPRGAYAARNAGLAVASGEILAFTDVDCRPHPDWIEQGRAALAAAPRVAGRVQLELSSTPSAAEIVDAGRFFRQRRYVQEGFGATANLFVQRGVVERVGRFNDRLKSGGDYEFGLRCTRAGIPIQYADNVVVSHSARASVRELLSKSERVGFGTGQLLRRQGIPLKLLASRVTDRVALARRRGVVERRVPLPGGTRSLAVSGLHSLVLLATFSGMVRGFLLPGPVAPAEVNVERMDLA